MIICTLDEPRALEKTTFSNEIRKRVNSERD